MLITLRTSRVKQVCCTVFEKRNVTVIFFCVNNMINVAKFLFRLS